jgi:hypothetical protein
MNNDDESQEQVIGNTANASNRNFSPQKYPEKMPNYSPSTAFNYGHHGGGYNGMQQHPRRRADRFKRETLNLNDKVVKQNDLIIRLLKEIRDRLPAPPNQELRSTPQPAENVSSVQDMVSDSPECPPTGEQDG